MPTAIVNWQLELAVEVQRCLLRSPSGKEEDEQEEREDENEKEKEQLVIESNNPHLASGENSRQVLVEA